MDAFDIGAPAVVPGASPAAPPASAPARIVALRELPDHGTPTTRPCDDLRQWTVVVWARTKLIERLIAAEGSVDPRLRAAVAAIEAAVAAIGAGLDALEDAKLRQGGRPIGFGNSPLPTLAKGK
jgi:hypothetical protein